MDTVKELDSYQGVAFEGNALLMINFFRMLIDKEDLKLAFFGGLSLQAIYA